MPSATSVDRAALAEGINEATPRKDLACCTPHRARHCLAMERRRNSWLGRRQLTQFAVRSFDTMTAARRGGAPSFWEFQAFFADELF